jgi:hypothetical protein
MSSASSSLTTSPARSKQLSSRNVDVSPTECATKIVPTITRTTSIDDLPAFLTVVELQNYLQIGRSAAYEFARAHGRKIGRLQRVPREALR